MESDPTEGEIDAVIAEAWRQFLAADKANNGWRDFDGDIKAPSGWWAAGAEFVWTAMGPKDKLCAPLCPSNYREVAPVVRALADYVFDVVLRDYQLRFGEFGTSEGLRSAFADYVESELLPRFAELVLNAPARPPEFAPPPAVEDRSAENTSKPAPVAPVLADSGDNQKPEFPHRAAWLREQLKERKWNKHNLHAYGGPDHKTTQKVLDGLRVQDGVLQRIADGLSAVGSKVDLSEIPPD